MGQSIASTAMLSLGAENTRPFCLHSPPHLLISSSPHLLISSSPHLLISSLLWPNSVYFKDDNAFSVWTLSTDSSVATGCSFLLDARLACVYGQVHRCSSIPHPRMHCLEVSLGIKPLPSLLPSRATSEVRVTKSGAQALRVQGQTALCPFTMRSS